MTDKPIAILQQHVGYPEYRLLDNGTTLHPLDAWDPPPGKRVFSAQELYDIFSMHCTAFMGDSLQRRAADTLHAVIEHRNTSSQNYAFSYFWRPRQGHGHYTRMIGAEAPGTSSVDLYKKKCEPGTIDSVWAPKHEGLLRYKYSKKYTIIVTGIGAWVNHENSPNEVLQEVNHSIHHIHKAVPKSTIVIWRSGAWHHGSPWNYVRSNENATSMSNYLMHCSNEAAKETINNINADNLIYIDWAKEILPYSFSQRIPTNMMAENGDHNAWHLGPKARALLLQMIASEVSPAGQLQPGVNTRFQKNSAVKHPKDQASATKVEKILEPNVANLQHIIGYPEYRLLDNGTTLHPLDVWEPPPEKHKFSAHELHEIFSKHCTAFMGDSQQRWAADTLHAMIEHSKRTPQSSNVVYSWAPQQGQAEYGNYTRVIGTEAPTWKHQYNNDCVPGTIDSLWAPEYEPLLNYAYQKEYSIIIIGFGPLVNEDITPNIAFQRVNQTIHHIYKVAPRSVLIIWRSGAWRQGSGWNFLEPNQKPQGGSNYLVQYSNRVAREIINKINADNLVFVDWAKEIFPYSFSQGKTTNMTAEGDSNSPWHIEPKARALLLQMIASDVATHHHTKQAKTIAFCGEDKVLVQHLPGTYLVVVALIVIRKFSRRSNKRGLPNAV